MQDRVPCAARTAQIYRSCLATCIAPSRRAGIHLLFVIGVHNTARLTVPVHSVVFAAQFFTLWIVLSDVVRLFSALPFVAFQYSLHLSSFLSRWDSMNHSINSSPWHLSLHAHCVRSVAVLVLTSPDAGSHVASRRFDAEGMES